MNHQIPLRRSTCACDEKKINEEVAKACIFHLFHFTLFNLNVSLGSFEDLADLSIVQRFISIGEGVQIIFYVGGGQKSHVPIGKLSCP